MKPCTACSHSIYQHHSTNTPLSNTINTKCLQQTKTKKQILCPYNQRFCGRLSSLSIMLSASKALF